MGRSLRATAPQQRTSAGRQPCTVTLDLSWPERTVDLALECGCPTLISNADLQRAGTLGLGRPALRCRRCSRSTRPVTGLAELAAAVRAPAPAR